MWVGLYGDRLGEIGYYGDGVFYNYNWGKVAARLYEIGLGQADGNAKRLPFYKRRTVTEWIKRLSNPDPILRMEAASALGNLGAAAGPAADLLAKSLRDDADPFVRRGAAWALGKIDAPKAVIPDLLRALKDKNEMVRANAVFSLRKLGRGSNEILRNVLAMLRDSSVWVRQGAVVALDDLRAPSAIVIPALIAALNDEVTEGLRGKEFSRDCVHELIAKSLASRAPDSIPTVIKLLSSPGVDTRWYAASALEQIGPRARSATQPLLTLLKDEEADVRGIAALALASVGDDDIVLPPLIQVLDDPSWDTQICVMSALKRFGPKAKKAVPSLIRALRTTMPVAVGVNAQEALVEIGEPAVPTLMELLKEEKAPRRAAASILGKIGPQAKAAVPILVVLLKDKEDVIARILFSRCGELIPSTRWPYPAWSRCSQE
jgi:HEAT repeat protein